MRALLVLVVAAGCRQLLGFDQPVTGDAEGPSCTTSATCPAQASVCKLPQGVCVECVDPATCDSTAPVCGVDNRCHGCTAHSDCASNVCLPTGECADQANVAYVAAAGSDGGSCSLLQPCLTINGAVATAKPIVKIQTDLTTTQEMVVGRSLSMFANPGLTLTRSNNGTVLHLASNATVSIFDLGVSSQGSGDGVLINNATGTLVRMVIHGLSAHGVLVQSGSHVVIDRCVIASNLGGGISLQNAVGNITNTLIVRNGSGSLNSGRVTIDPNAGSRFDFNTVADNASQNVVNSGINCLNPIPMANNIVTNNALGAQCAPAAIFTLLDNSTSPFPTNTGNKLGEPKFDLTDPASLLDPRFYRIRDGSDAIDSADPAATLAEDIDGEPRPNGTIRDIGADEVH